MKERLAATLTDPRLVPGSSHFSRLSPISYHPPHVLSAVPSSINWLVKQPSYRCWKLPRRFPFITLVKSQGSQRWTVSFSLFFITGRVTRHLQAGFAISRTKFDLVSPVFLFKKLEKYFEFTIFYQSSQTYIRVWQRWIKNSAASCKKLFHFYRRTNRSP